MLKPPDFEILIAHAPANSFKNAREARDWAKKELQGHAFVNRDTGLKISIGRKAIDKFTSEAAVRKSDGQAHFDAVRALSELIEIAVEGERREDRVMAMHIQAVHRFFAPIEIGGIFYRVKLTVFSHRDPENARFYTHEVTEIEMPADTGAGAGPADATTFPAGKVKLDHLLAGVKRDDGTDYFPARPAKKSRIRKGAG